MSSSDGRKLMERAQQVLRVKHYACLNQWLVTPAL